jgi:hydrogenase maturation factor
VAERKGFATKRTLELLSSEPTGLQFDTFRIHPKELIVGVVPEMAEDVLGAIRKNPLGKNAAIIGHATSKVKGVVLRTEVGGRRILEPPVGDPVPRIC